jgi:hypothetical protein
MDLRRVCRGFLLLGTVLGSRGAQVEAAVSRGGYGAPALDGSGTCP